LARTTVVDLHADSLLWGRDLNTRGTWGQVDVPRLIEGNVALQVFTMVTKSPRGLNVDSNSAGAPDDITPLAFAQRWPVAAWSSLTERALHQASRFRDTVERSNGKLVWIRSRDGLDEYLRRRAQDRNVTAGLLGIEGAHAIDADLANLDRVFDAGVRLISPSHFFDNFAGGSSAGESKGRLTEAGRELIRRMWDKGMVVDLAHSSARQIEDVLAMAKGPVMVSHTGVRGTCDNNRNLTDAQLRAIAAAGGVVGIAYFDAAVCEVTPRGIARAFRHAASVIGVDHLALGSDFDGAVGTPFDATGIASLFDALFEARFTDADVEKIAGQNALRVLRASLPRHPGANEIR
jgi:microsomal dipeptidase-like Zn-dependent dipeptidase